MFIPCWMIPSLATLIGLRQQPTLLTLITSSLLDNILGIFLQSHFLGRDRILLTFMFLVLDAGPKYLSPTALLNLTLKVLNVVSLDMHLVVGIIKSKTLLLIESLFRGTLSLKRACLVVCWQVWGRNR